MQTQIRAVQIFRFEEEISETVFVGFSVSEVKVRVAKCFYFRKL